MNCINKTFTNSVGGKYVSALTKVTVVMLKESMELIYS